MTATFTAAPGSTVVVRDEDWLVTKIDPATDGFFVHVVGLSELVRDTEATFSTALDEIIESDPAGVQVKGDDSHGFRKTKLWLEAMLRKTPVPIADPELTVANRGLADTLKYQLKAVRQALDPDNLRPRILLADDVMRNFCVSRDTICARKRARGAVIHREGVTRSRPGSALGRPAVPSNAPPIQ